MNRKETHMELDQKQKEVWMSAQVGCLPVITVTHPDDCRLTWGHTIAIMFRDAETATVGTVSKPVTLQHMLDRKGWFTYRGEQRFGTRLTITKWQSYSMQKSSS
jgi:hypothetical protein